MSAITLHDKTFVPFISKDRIQERVKQLAEQIDKDYSGMRPLFIAILNGSFIFAADLIRSLTIEAEISFIKLASYKGTSSTGSVVTAIGMEESLYNRHVVLVEDIVDTGRTLYSFLPEILSRHPASFRIATLLCKPVALQYEITPNYCGFEIEDKFVVGYGLDYDGLGRNLSSLYQLVED